MHRPSVDPVDAVTAHEWEADLASRVAAALLFWAWYLPADMIRHRTSS
jgi:hypothetical protein